jgi:NADPH-dependent glutamate synthase beta subunit-like oxidoreductase/Pyruvate/2-oxoacid:ferredoxin oxidoreductase delta subunit
MTTTTTLQPEKLNFRRYKDGDASFKSWREQIFQAGWSYKCPTYIQSTPPCQGSCPAGEDIRGYLNIVAGIEKPPKGPDGKPTMTWQEYAWRRITEANPFPAIMGRVCPAPCQTGCNRNQLEGYVGINSVEHYLGNWALEHGLKFDPPAKETGRRVAIVGGGVAGLSAAYHLRRRGHAVVVFEAFDKLGGMLSFGLPDYRTPHDVVDAEIQRILDMGVEARVNVKVGVDVSLADLKRDFDAVYLGIGAQRGSGLDVPGSDAPNIVDGLTFLHDYNDGASEAAGRRIVVIGGGDTAMDCASVARRLGARAADGSLRKGSKDGRAEAEVVIAYRRTIAEMPALKHEIAAVLQEGVRIEPLVVPIEVVKDAQGRATALRVQDVEWVNKKMLKKEGTEHDIPCDLVVTAIGQVVDWTGMEGLKNDKGLARVDRNLVTEPGVFVGGDAIKPHLLTTAIGHGRIAAEGIDRYVAGLELDRRPKVDVNAMSLAKKMVEAGTRFETVAEPIRGTDRSKAALHNFDDRSDRYVIQADQLFLGHFAPVARAEREEREIDAHNVLGNIDERLLPLSEAQVLVEAKRCMSCGMCFECDNCIVYCPQQAVSKVPKKEATLGRYVTTDYDKCIGCHICKDVCPTGYIQMGLGE